MKVGFFITARLKSERLKKKILLELNGKTVLDRVIERAKATEGVDGVVLCTSINSQDYELMPYAQANHINFFQGSENDVLKRLLDAANQYGYDAFVSITADNPLFSIETSNELVRLYLKNSYDFLTTKGLPIGCATHLIDVRALKVVNFLKNSSNTEIWGPFINRPDFFNVAELVVENSLLNENIRITIDYEEDYKLIEKIYMKFKEEYIPNISEVFDVLSLDRSLLGINAMHKQAYLSKEEREDIDQQFTLQSGKAKRFADEISKELKPGYSEFKIKLSYGS